MIISVNWLKKYLPAKLQSVGTSELAERIGARLVEIESTTELAAKYAPAVIAKVISCEKHPDSDHLHVCLIDDGGVTMGMERNDDGYVQVVCGAPNVRQGLAVAWLPPGSIVPETYGTADEFRLSDRKLRGVLSHGMLASPRELGLWNEHEGIMEIADTSAQPGGKLVDLLDLDDCLLEVENKSLTHRPDCFGMIGFAREVAAIFDETAVIPDWFNKIDGCADGVDEPIHPTITIADPTLCARYECVILDHVNGQSQLPELMRSLVARSGANSINAPVDITNYLMYETGQPLHAFDLDKLMAVSPTHQPDIVVRAATQGETLELLDGRTIELDPKDIVIAAGDTACSVPVALAGAMGGLATEITPQTKRILLESATFDLYHLRGTQFRHGVFSEAVTRFTKGQPAMLTHPVLLRAIELMEHYAGAGLAGSIADTWSMAKPGEAQTPTIELSVDDFTKVLGWYGGQASGYDLPLIKRTLTNLQYGVTMNGEQLLVTAPWWRTDLHIAEDVIEDVGRVNGYDDIVGSLPKRPLTAAPYDRLYQKQMWLRDRLKEAGGNEVMTYSFIHGDLLDKVGDDKARAYRIVNAISPDLQYYRRDLLPNLLERARDNLRAGYNDFMLFELGKVHRRGLMDPAEPDLPREIPEVSGVLVDKNQRLEPAFYQLKKIVQYALDIDQAQLVYTRLDQFDGQLDSSTNLFEPQRSAVLTIVANGEQNYVGVLGEFKTSVRRALKLPDYAAGFTVMMAELLDYLDDGSIYTPVLRYQGTSRDITYQVSEAMTYQQVYDFTRRVLADKLPDEVVAEVAPRDIYRADGQCQHITLHIDFHDRRRTIDAKLVNKMMERLAKQAKNELSATVL